MSYVVTALAYVAMAAMGGPVKTAGSYLFDSSPQGQWLYQQKEALLVGPLAGIVGTCGFDAQTDADQQAVYPASHVISSVGVDAVLSTVGAIGVNKGVKSIVEGAEGFSKKVDAADQLAGGGGERGILGAQGTQTASKTIWKGDGKERLDVENPNPGQRPGQIHYQDNSGNKYLYDPASHSFPGASKSVNKLLENPRFLQAIEKGMKKYLGESI